MKIQYDKEQITINLKKNNELCQFGTKFDTSSIFCQAKAIPNNKLYLFSVRFFSSLGLNLL